MMQEFDLRKISTGSDFSLSSGKISLEEFIVNIPSEEETNSKQISENSNEDLSHYSGKNFLEKFCFWFRQNKPKVKNDDLKPKVEIYCTTSLNLVSELNPFQTVQRFDSASEDIFEKIIKNQDKILNCEHSHIEELDIPTFLRSNSTLSFESLIKEDRNFSEKFNEFNNRVSFKSLPKIADRNETLKQSLKLIQNSFQTNSSTKLDVLKEDLTFNAAIIKLNRIF